MIIAKLKDFQEIRSMVAECRSVLALGCAGCTAICLAGGQREVDELVYRLVHDQGNNGRTSRIEGYTIERQCENQFLAEIDSVVKPFDALLSLACGAGVQYLAERFAGKPVLPAVDTTFVGVNRDIGWYEERCRCCGDCVLGITGGICPVTMCAKSLFNGPCGGAHDGCCEVDAAVPCAWVAIYHRLKQQNRLKNILDVHPARSWRDQVPGSFVLEKYRTRYTA